MIPTGLDAHGYLRQLVQQGAIQMFNQQPPAKILQQLEHELALIRLLEFAD
jgi:hypothetical protein